MRWGDGNKVYRHVALRPLVLLALLGTCSPSPEPHSQTPPPEGRLAEGSGTVDLRWAAVSTATARRNVGDSRPRLGDSNKPMDVGIEDVVIGIVTLEGMIPPDVQDDVAYCTRKSLATLALVPTSYISMSVTNEYSSSHAKNVVKFHFILLPVKGKATSTSNALQQSAVGGGSIAPFLILLTREMRELDSLSQYYVLGLQFSVRIPAPQESQLEIWKNKDYGTVAVQGPTTKPPPAGTSAAPPDPNACLTTYSPCACAALGTCAWVENPNTGISSCTQSTYGSKNVPCAACPVQERCTDEGCSEVVDACDCAAASYGCRWNEAGGTCQRGSGTSCVACPRQSSCSTVVPRVVSFMPLSGSYVKPHGGGQQLRLGFDRAIQFLVTSQGTAAFHCQEQVQPISISRPRMKIEVNYLILDVSGLIQTSSGTNNARRCNLIIGEGLVSDTYGVPYLGMNVGEYSVNIGDTLAPQVLDFSPKNGEIDVQPTAVVTLTFSEPIELGPAAKNGNLKVTLSRLEEGEVLAFVAELELKPPGVNVENQLLKVDLNGKIESGFQYTLSLPSGAVADREQNAFTGLAPRAYVFKTAAKTTVYQTGEASSGVPLTSLIAVSGALILILGFGILTVWWMRIWSAARKNKVQQQPPQRSTTKLSGANVTYMDTTGRSPSQRSSISSMRSSTSVYPDDVPKAQAPLDAFTGANSANTMDFDPFHGQSEKPKLKRAGTWAPGMVPTVSQKSDGAHRSSSKESKQEEDLRKRQAEEDRRRKKDEENRRKLEAKQRWASARNMAFSQARAKQAASPSAPPMDAAADGLHSDPFGPRSAGDAGRDRAPEGRPTSSPTAEGRSASKRSKNSTDGIPGQPSSSPPGQPSSSPSGGAARSSSRTSVASAPDENPELRKQKKDVEKRLRELMDSPMEVRKKAMKELMLEYHPDKNSDQHATQIFQYINGSKVWFLHET